MPANNRRGGPRAPQQNGAARPAPVPEWRVRASDGAMNTSNPIREIIETMNLAENPNKKVIPLSIGDPTIFGNLKPCQAILDALQRANASGKYYGYQTAAGMESARRAVAHYHNQSAGGAGVELAREQDVILASGCSHAIDLAICVLARHGQNILIPRPGFPLYKTLTSVYGVEFKQYNLLADKNWSVDLRHLESLIDADTAAIVVNNPSNPCGSVFSRRHLLEILELAERHRLPIISDEIYDKFVFSAPESKNKKEKERTKSSKMSSKKSDRVPGAPKRRPASQGSQTSMGPADSGHYEATGAPDDQERGRNGHPPGRDQGEDQDQDQDGEGERPEGEGKTTPKFGEPTMMGEHNDDARGLLVQSDCSADEGEDSALEEDDDDDEEENDENDDDEGGAPRASGRFRYARFRSLAALSETVPILTCGGISKTCLIPGLRLGWIIINDKKNIFDASVRHGLSRLTQRLMGPNSLVQGALHDILANVPEDFYKQTMEFIFKNAKLCYERLLKVRGLNPYMPQGSMYLMVGFNPKLFPDIDGDLDFTSKLMNEQSVLVLPGKCFDFPNFFRICLTVPTVVMEDALDRIEEFCCDHVTPPETPVASDKMALDCKARQAILKHGLVDTTNGQRQQRVPTISSNGAKQSQSMKQHRQQSTGATLNKKPFELTAPSNMNGSQQLARSKCK